MSNPIYVNIEKFITDVITETDDVEPQLTIDFDQDSCLYVARITAKGATMYNQQGALSATGITINEALENLDHAAQ